MKINMRFYTYLDRDLRSIHQRESFSIQVAEKNTYNASYVQYTFPVSRMVFEIIKQSDVVRTFPEIVYSSINSGLPNIYKEISASVIFSKSSELRK
jgi:hypothetical protein